MVNILLYTPLVIDTTGDITNKSLTGIAVCPNAGTDTVRIQRRRAGVAAETVHFGVGQHQWTFPRPVTSNEGFTVTITGTPIVLIHH